MYSSPESSEVMQINSSLSLRLSPERKFRPDTCVRCCCIPCRCCCRCCCFPCCCYIKCCMNSSYNGQNDKTFESSIYQNQNQQQQQQQQGNNLNDNVNNVEEYNPIKEEEEQFKNYLVLLMQQEADIEKKKIELALCYDFNVEDLFRFFEVCCRGYLTLDDLIEGLCILGININREDARLLLKRFDLKNKGILVYEDFFDLIVPYEKEYRNMVEYRKPSSCCPCRSLDNIKYNTKIKIKCIFESILEYERIVNDIRKNNVMLRVKLGEIYSKIDKLNLGYFINDDFIRYLKENGIFRLMRDADLLFIRLDRNRNGKIEKNEIKDELDPRY